MYGGHLYIAMRQLKWLVLIEYEGDHAKNVEFKKYTLQCML